MSGNEVSGTVHGPVVQAGVVQGGVHLHGNAGPRLEPIALYYPYIHIRDDRWLKYAALYWWKMARLKPIGYPAGDSPEAAPLLDEWLIDVAPDRAASPVSESFLRLTVANAARLRQRYGLTDGDRRWFFARPGAPRRFRMDPRLGYVHVSKMSYRLVDAIVDAGLGDVAHDVDGEWLGVHAELASVYMCAMAEEVAAKEHLHPVTDQVLPYAASAGWSVDRLAEVLLGERHTAPPRDPVGRFVIAAFEAVVPANLDAVPFEKIMEVRERYRRELNAFRQYVTEQVEGLTRLGDIRDVDVYRAHLEHEVERTVRDRLDDLRDRLLELGLEPSTALVAVKAPIDAVGPTSRSHPTGALSAHVVEAPRQRRDRVIRESPVGYLFHVGEELSTSELAHRVYRAMS
ncbi:DUF6236 family protein [Saccharothrix luteola]|uniref:DUF6236 family protein n=1 Tax=Saccharothrix luteola TaxID=2893018 RepID=UPI001E482C76|nr:DUF6236 family protein [Saccharothrix luteola]MCC8250063.1 DUF6236 family protein [Saccharothrix luteola]